MTRYRNIRLLIHPSPKTSAWSLVLRTYSGQTLFDRRLHMGFLDHDDAVGGIVDISRALRQIADDLDSRHGIASAPEAPREPLGAVGGGPDHRPGRVCAHSCPRCGEHLDGMPSDD